MADVPNAELKRTTVADTANQCLESFQTCLTQASLVHPRELSKVEDQIARFSTWAAGIGVFAPGRASMDHRLRYAPEVQSVVIGLLESLNYRIRTCSDVLDLLAKSPTPYAWDEHVSNDHVQPERPFRDVATEISRLNKTSNTIRRATKEAQILKASSFQIQDDDGNDAAPLLLSHFERHIGDRFRNTISGILEQRLARAMLLRRKRILYRRHRQGNIFGWPRATISKAPLTMPTTAAPTPPSAQGKSNQENERTTSGVATTIIAPSQIKSATTLGPDKFKIASSSPSAVSSTKTVALGNHEALVFPPAPGASAKRNYEQLKKQREADFQVAVGLGQEISEAQSRLDELLKSDLQAIGEITCPYCLYALPAQEMFEDRKWQNHVKNDLDPYVCLFENCNEPDLLYSHSEEWLSHMRQHGMLWRCSSHRKLGPFSTREEYMEHVRRDHRSKHSDAQLRALANRSTHKTANLFPSCPLCGKHEVETDNRLEDHIAGHLRSLALKSLPSYQEDIPDDAGSGRSSVDTSRPRSRSTVKDLNSDDDMLEFEAEHSWDHSDSASSSQEAWELASWNFYESAAEGPPTALEDDPIIQSMLQKRDGSQKGKAVAAVEPNVIPPALASATPSSSQEAPPAEQQPPAEPQPFHNFLRAFYPFKPNDFVSDSSVRLALDTGDIVLVHSVDPSGWADGNLLISGKRGWLPTNYCEPYEPGEMRVLLEAVLNLWDVLRSATSEEDNEIFRDQEFIRGTIAGVRFLLEQTDCLTRESPLVQGSDSVRRCRKLLLAELSALVNTAKSLQDMWLPDAAVSDVNVDDIIDEIILGAFRVVTKGARFMDVLEHDRTAHPSSPTPGSSRLASDESEEEAQLEGHEHEVPCDGSS